MTYQKRHPVIQNIPFGQFDNTGEGKVALRILKETELTWEERAELDDAIEDLWILVNKVRTRNAK